MNFNDELIINYFIFNMKRACAPKSKKCAAFKGLRK